MSAITCRTCWQEITYKADPVNPASQETTTPPVWVDATNGNDRCEGVDQHFPISKRYSIAKQVVATHSYMAGPAFEGIMLDATSASAIVAVHEALSPRNQERFDDIPLPKLMDFVWKYVTH